MGVDVTALLVGAKARPSVEVFSELVAELWNEGVVAPHAVLSVGPVLSEAPVASAVQPGEGRSIRWTGDDLPGLLAALRAAYEEDVAVWFDATSLDAFDPPEDEDDEDDDEDDDDDADEDEDEDEGDAGDDEGDEAATPAADHDLGEFDLVPPSLCLYSVRRPVDLRESSAYAATPKEKAALATFGPRAAWATLDGEDMALLFEDLGGSWLREVVEGGLGPVKIGRNLW